MHREELHSFRFYLSLKKRLIQELFRDTPLVDRCEHIRQDNDGPYCGKDLPESKYITPDRRSVCCILSLQMWCLDKERRKNCIIYQGEQFEQPELN